MKKPMGSTTPPKVPGDPPHTRVEITTGTFVKLVAVAGAVWLLTELWYVFVLITIALVLVGTLNPLVVWLEQRRLPRAAALTIIFVGMLGILFLIGLITVPPLIQQLVDIMAKAPALQERLAEQMRHSRLLRPLAASVRDFRIAEIMGSAGEQIVAMGSRVLVIVGEGVTTVFLALYLISGREREQGALFAVVPRAYHLRLARILLNLETIVGGYVRGQLLTSVAMGTFTFGILTIFGVPNALALGVFAALTDVVPFIGGLLATTPAVLAALGVSIPAAVVVLVAMILYQEFESRLLVPRVYGRVLRLSPAVVIVSLLAGGTLLGIVGALLALPIAAALRMIVKELRVELPGEEEASQSIRDRDEEAETEYQRRSAGAPAVEAAAIAASLAESIRDSGSQAGESGESVEDEPMTDGTSKKETK
jgi:putative heme transporter